VSDLPLMIPPRVRPGTERHDRPPTEIEALLGDLLKRREEVARSFVRSKIAENQE